MQEQKSDRIRGSSMKENATLDWVVRKCTQEEVVFELRDMGEVSHARARGRPFQAEGEPWDGSKLSMFTMKKGGHCGWSRVNKSKSRRK